MVWYIWLSRKNLFINFTCLFFHLLVLLLVDFSFYFVKNLDSGVWLCVCFNNLYEKKREEEKNIAHIECVCVCVCVDFK